MFRLVLRGLVFFDEHAIEVMNRAEETEAHFGDKLFEVWEVVDEKFVFIIQQIKVDIDHIFGGGEKEFELFCSISICVVVEFAFFDEDDAGDFFIDVLVEFVFLFWQVGLFFLDLVVELFRVHILHELVKVHFVFP